MILFSSEIFVVLLLWLRHLLVTLLTAIVLNFAGNASMLTCYHRLSKAIFLTIAVKLLGSTCIQVDIERLISLAVKLNNFWGLKIGKKVIILLPNVWFLWKLQICNPHSSYHTTAAVGECLVNIWFAETCKVTLFTFFKDFYRFEKCIWSLLHAQAVWACSFVWGGGTRMAGVKSMLNMCFPDWNLHS